MFRFKCLKPFKFLHGQYYDERLVVFGNRHRCQPCGVDQFTEMILRVGR